MLHFVLTLKDGTKKTLQLKDLRKHSLFIGEEEFEGDPGEWFDNDQLSRFVEGEEVIKVKVVMEDFDSDLKKLTKNGREALRDLINRMFPDFEDLSNREAEILRKYANEILGEIPQELIENSKALEQAKELVENLAKAKPGDQEEIYSEAEKVIKQLLRREQITIHDELYKRFFAVAKQTVSGGSFDHFHEIEVLKDEKTPIKTKVKIVEDGLSLHRIPEELFRNKDFCSTLSNETKDRLILESHFEADLIRRLKFFDEKLMKGALDQWNVSEASWEVILDLYKPNDKELKKIASHSESFKALLNIGYITKDTLTDDMMSQDPKFFLDLPWVRKDEKLVLKVLKNASKYDLGEIAQPLLSLESSKVESAFIDRAEKPLIAGCMELFSSEGKKKAKAKLLADLKASEAEFVLSGLAGMLDEKEAEKVEKLAVKTVDGAVETLKNSTNPNLRKLAITRLLGSEAQRVHVFGLRDVFQFTDAEVVRIGEYIKERDFSSWELQKVHPSILLSNQQEFKKQLITLIHSAFNRNRDISEHIAPKIEDSIYVEAFNNYSNKHEAYSGLLGSIDEVTPEKVGRILLATKFDLRDHLNLLSYRKEELQSVANTLPKGKALKGFEILAGESKDFDAKTAVYIAKTSDGKEQEAAIQWLLKTDANKYDAKELRSISSRLEYDSNRDQFLTWAKDNSEFFAYEIYEYGHLLHEMISTEEDMKKAIFLMRSQNERRYGNQDRRLIEIAAEKFPMMVLSTPEIFVTEEFSKERVFERVLSMRPEVIDIATHKESILGLNLSARNAVSSYLDKIMKLSGSDDQKIDLFFDMVGADKAGREAIAFICSEATAEFARKRLPEVLKRGGLKAADLIEYSRAHDILNDFGLTKEDLLDVSTMSLETLYENCPKHRNLVVSMAFDYVTKSMGFPFNLDGEESLGTAVLELMTAESIKGNKGLSYIVTAANEGRFNQELTKKIRQATNMIPVGARVKAKAKLINGDAEIIISGNEALQQHFGGDIHKPGIIMSVPVERAIQFMTDASELHLIGTTVNKEGFPELHVDIDEALAKEIVKNGNKEINELVKEKSKKLIDEMGLLASLSPKRKWSLSLQMEGIKDVKKDEISYPISEAEEAIRKGLADAHNQTTRASSVKQSPLVKKNQKDSWSVPKYRAGRGRRFSGYHSKAGSLPGGEILGPIYTGAEAMSEAASVLERLTESLDIKQVKLTISATDIQKMSEATQEEVSSLVSDLEPVLVLTGAFSGGNQVWGDEFMDSIEVNHDIEKGEISVSLRGRFSNGRGIAKTLGVILGIIEEGIKAIKEKREKALAGELDVTASVREMVEKNLDMKAIMKSQLMLKTLAGQKMLFAS